MPHKRRELLCKHIKHVRKHGQPLLPEKELKDLQGRVRDDVHAIRSYKKTIIGHYGGYYATQEILDALNGSNQRESAHYSHETSRHAQSLAMKCASFHSFSEGNYTHFLETSKKQGKDIKKALKEIKEKYGFEYLKI